MSITKSHVLVEVNSRDRDSGAIENFTYHLSHQIKFSQAPTKSYFMRLEDVMIPKTFYDVDSTNNVFRVIETGGTFSITIPEGNYTITELITQLESDLDTNSPDSNTYTLTYDDITNKISFQVDFVGSAAVSIDTIANGSTLNDLLGLGKTTPTLTDATIVLADGVASEGTYTVDLDTKSYIVVETDITSHNYYDKDIQKHVGTIVPFNVDRNEKQYYANHEGHLTKMNNKGPISTIKFQLIDEIGNQIDLQGAEYSFTLCIYEVTEIWKQ